MFTNCVPIEASVKLRNFCHIRPGDRLFSISGHIFEKLIFGKWFTNCAQVEISVKYSKFLPYAARNIDYFRYPDIFLKKLFFNKRSQIVPR